MKKIFSLVLCFLLCLGVFAGCGEEKKGSGSGVFSVGFGRADVTPTTSVPLDGYQGTQAAQYRWSDSTSWPFYALCIAFTDGAGNTVLVMTLDMLNAYMADSMREVVSKETGVPKSNIMFHCTHNHSGPSLRIDSPDVTNYLTQLTNGVMSAAKMAMEDRKPVTGMQTTYARPEQCNSERHYLLADGSYQSYDVGSVPKDQLIGHYGVADNLLQLVKFTREGGKDVMMVNWQGHPPGGETLFTATANYPGVLRNYLETNLGCEAMFVLGGSGNLNNSSQIAGEIRHDNYQQLGQNLGAAAVEATANFTDRKIDNIRVKEKQLLLTNRDGGAAKVWIYAISIGDLVFVTAPFEIFDDNAVAVRESSPYAMTMYASCCNGSNGYLPTPPSFGWEITYESRTTNFPQGTAELVESELKGLVSEMASESGYTAVEKPEDYYQGEFEPKTDGVTYQLLTFGKAENVRKVENDFYAFQAVGEMNKVRNFLTNDPAIAEKVVSMTTAQFLFNEQNVIVGIVE